MNEQELINNLLEIIENSVNYIDQWLIEADPETEAKLYRLIDLLEGRE